MPAGRPRSFDEDEALERAMEFFWQQGYHGARLSELLDHMDIARQSLYDTFGSKRELFVESVLHYRRTRLSQALALLEREGAQLDNVRAVLRFFRGLARDKRCRGCFVANCLVELAPHDTEIAALLQETLDLLEQALRRTLRRAQREGELAPDASPRQLARALINSMVGMAVTGKLELSRRAIDDIYDGTLRMLA